jgi:hypothetical protein
MNLSVSFQVRVVCTDTADTHTQQARLPRGGLGRRAASPLVGLSGLGRGAVGPSAQRAYQ